jgi:hypothetical protein
VVVVSVTSSEVVTVVLVSVSNDVTVPSVEVGGEVSLVTDSSVVGLSNDVDG